MLPPHVPLFTFSFSFLQLLFSIVLQQFVELTSHVAVLDDAIDETSEEEQSRTTGDPSSSSNPDGTPTRPQTPAPAEQPTPTQPPTPSAIATPQRVVLGKK